MMERFLDWFINWKYCLVVEVTAVVWSFVFYWISVSGWQFMIEWKLAIGLTPVVLFTVYYSIKGIIVGYRNRRRQKEIMLNVKIRRILDQYVA